MEKNFYKKEFLHPQDYNDLTNWWPAQLFFVCMIQARQENFSLTGDYAARKGDLQHQEW